MIDLEKILNKKPIINDLKNYIANINEQLCIGCTKCITACPFDAIIGSAKLMHNVLIDECTGCGFCINPCPVDCISMIEVENKYLPRNPFLSNDNNLKQSCENHAKLRFNAKRNRLNKKNNNNINNDNIDIKNIIINAKNKQRTKYQTNKISIIDNQLQQQIILKAKQKSLKCKQKQNIKK